MDSNPSTNGLPNSSDGFQPSSVPPTVTPSVGTQPVVQPESLGSTQAQPLPSPSFVSPNTVSPLQPITPQASPTTQSTQQTFTPSQPISATPPVLNQPEVHQYDAQPPKGSGAVTFGSGGSSPSKRKIKRLSIGGVVLAILLIPAVVFGYYLPNKPSHVYATGINRSGKALDSLVNSATEKSKLEAYKKSDISITADVTAEDSNSHTTFNTKFDSNKAKGDLNYDAKIKGRADAIFNLQFMAEVPENSQYPNVYLKLTGIHSLGWDSFSPAIPTIDGKWLSISADYLKSLGNVPTNEEVNKKKLSSDDFAELAQAATSVTTDYVFSTTSNKAVFINKSFEGKEKVDDINTYHYKVAINKDNAKAYCKAMAEKIYSTTAYKKLPWVDENNVDKDKAAAIKDCDSFSSGIKDSTTYDLWVDAKYKLIYKIRITDSTDKNIYTDVGQVYKGGDEVSLFTSYHNSPDKIDGKFTLDTNLKTSITKGTARFEIGEGKDAFEGKVTLEAKPFTGDINIEKPAGAIPIQDFLKQLGVDPKEFTA